MVFPWFSHGFPIKNCDFSYDKWWIFPLSHYKLCPDPAGLATDYNQGIAYSKLT